VTQAGHRQRAAVAVGGDANRLDLAQRGACQPGRPWPRGSGNDWVVEQAGSGLAIRVRHVGDGQLRTIRQAGPRSRRLVAG